MTTSFSESFEQNYQCHLQHLNLKGLQTITIDAYSRPVRQIRLVLDYQIDTLSKQQLWIILQVCCKRIPGANGEPIE